jgi:hypothetical protein
MDCCTSPHIRYYINSVIYCFNCKKIQYKDYIISKSQQFVFSCPRCAGVHCSSAYGTIYCRDCSEYFCVVTGEVRGDAYYYLGYYGLPIELKRTFELVNYPY